MAPRSEERPARRPWRVARSAVLVAVTLAYPFVVHATLSNGSRPRRVAAILLGLYLAAFVLGRIGEGRLARTAAAARPLWPAVACLVAAAALDAPWALYATPVALNLVLLAVFAASLRPGRTPLVERFARAADPDLPPAGVRHCRQVTWAWVAFFAVNATVTAALAVVDPALWALHTGLVAYGAMGAMFAGEYVVRRIRMSRTTPPAAARQEPRVP